MNIAANKEFIIRVYFQTWDYESLEIGETDNKGMKEEIIYTSKDFDFFDTMEEFLDEVCKKISSYGTYEGSQGIYCSIDDDINFRTGERTSYSISLTGFDPFSDIAYIEKKLDIK